MDQADYSQALESLLRTEHAALVAMLDRRVPRPLRGAIGPEDVAQEAALDAVRSIHRFRPADGLSLRRWVWRIARRRLCDLIRSHRRLKRRAAAAAGGGGNADGTLLDMLPAAGTCPIRAAGDSEAVNGLRAALDALPPSYRQAVQLRYLDGLSVDEAAARLGRTPAAVLVLCSRALKLLRREMQDPAAGCRRPVAA